MQNRDQMRAGAIWRSCARMLAAAALACGLAGGAGIVAAATPQAAFADVDAGAHARVQEEGQSSATSSILAGADRIRLTRLDARSVLVELMEADKETTVSVGLSVLNAAGATLEGAAFAFTPEALALPTAHAVANGDGLTVVVSNGVNAISSDGGVFALGPLSLPEGAAKVAVTALASVDASGSESIQQTTAPNLGELDLIAGSGSGSGSDDGNAEKPGNTDNATNTDAGTNTNTSDASNTHGGGNGSNGGDGSTGGNGGHGSYGSYGSGSTNGQTSGGQDLPQTGDGQVVDASAFLLLAGGAAFIAAVIFILRRRIS